MDYQPFLSRVLPGLSLSFNIRLHQSNPLDASIADGIWAPEVDFNTEPARSGVATEELRKSALRHQFVNSPLTPQS
jgi:hypothetical protein